MKTISEISTITGLSKRAIRFYDESGLLHPAGYSDAGYRLYDYKALETLQQIMFFKEFDVPLKDIKAILENPNLDKIALLKSHKEALTLKRNRLNNLIKLIDKTIKTPETMSFMEFDFAEDPDFADRMLRRVQEVRAIPLVAHAERYEFVQDDPEIVWNWKMMGCEIQVNKGSFLGRFGTGAQKAAFQLLNHNLVTVVASDAHSPVRRTTCMADAYEYLRKEYPKKYLDALFHVNPRNICNGRKTAQFRKIPFEKEYGWKERV